MMKNSLSKNALLLNKSQDVIFEKDSSIEYTANKRNNMKNSTTVLNNISDDGEVEISKISNQKSPHYPDSDANI
jgi:hypothetical protein